MDGDPTMMEMEEAPVVVQRRVRIPPPAPERILNDLQLTERLKTVTPTLSHRDEEEKKYEDDDDGGGGIPFDEGGADEDILVEESKHNDRPQSYVALSEEREQKYQYMATTRSSTPRLYQQRLEEERLMKEEEERLAAVEAAYDNSRRYYAHGAPEPDGAYFDDYVTTDDDIVDEYTTDEDYYDEDDALLLRRNRRAVSPPQDHPDDEVASSLAVAMDPVLEARATSMTFQVEEDISFLGGQSDLIVTTDDERAAATRRGRERPSQRHDGMLVTDDEEDVTTLETATGTYTTSSDVASRVSDDEDEVEELITDEDATDEDMTDEEHPPVENEILYAQAAQKARTVGMSPLATTTKSKSKLPVSVYASGCFNAANRFVVEERRSTDYDEEGTECTEEGPIEDMETDEERGTPAPSYLTDPPPSLLVQSTSESPAPIFYDYGTSNDYDEEADDGPVGFMAAAGTLASAAMAMVHGANNNNINTSRANSTAPSSPRNSITSSPAASSRRGSQPNSPPQSILKTPRYSPSASPTNGHRAGSLGVPTMLPGRDLLVDMDYGDEVEPLGNDDDVTDDPIMNLRREDIRSIPLPPDTSALRRSYGLGGLDDDMDDDDDTDKVLEHRLAEDQRRLESPPRLQLGPSEESSFGGGGGFGGFERAVTSPPAADCIDEEVDAEAGSHDPMMMTTEASLLMTTGNNDDAAMEPSVGTQSRNVRSSRSTDASTPARSVKSMEPPGTLTPQSGFVDPDNAPTPRNGRSPEGSEHKSSDEDQPPEKQQPPEEDDGSLSDLSTALLAGAAAVGSALVGAGVVVANMSGLSPSPSQTTTKSPSEASAVGTAGAAFSPPAAVARSFSPPAMAMSDDSPVSVDSIPPPPPPDSPPPIGKPRPPTPPTRYNRSLSPIEHDEVGIEAQLDSSDDEYDEAYDSFPVDETTRFHTIYEHQPARYSPANDSYNSDDSRGERLATIGGVAAIGTPAALLLSVDELNRTTGSATTGSSGSSDSTYLQINTSDQAKGQVVMRSFNKKSEQQSYSRGVKVNKDVNTSMETAALTANDSYYDEKGAAIREDESFHDETEEDGDFFYEKAKETARSMCPPKNVMDCVLLSVVLLLLALILVLGVGMGTGAFGAGSKDKNGADGGEGGEQGGASGSPVADGMPTMAPGSSPTPTSAVPRAEAFQALAPIFLVDPSVLNDTSNPAEARAYQWLIDEDPANLDPNDPSTHVRIQQRFSLLTLWFNSPDDWVSEEGWLSEDECGWYGVVCNNAGHVSQVDMEENGLIGTLSPDISGLTHLKYLNVHENAMDGTVPSTMGLLTKLQVLHLGGNEFSGNLEDQIDFTALSILRVLDVGENRFDGPIPQSLYAVSTMKVVALHENQFTGTVSPSVANWTDLEQLRLFTNEFEGPIPTELASMAPTMTAFALGDNGFEQDVIPEYVYNMPNLVTLQLHNMNLVGTISPRIGTLTALETLQLHENELGGRIPIQIGQLTVLEQLYLQDNTLEQSIPTQIGNLVELSDLRVQGNSLTGQIPSSITDLVKILFLYIGDNFLTGTIPADFGNLRQLRDFRALRNNVGDGRPGIGGPIPTSFGQLTRLGILGLFRNSLTGAIPTEFGQLEGLVQLDVEQNRLSGDVPTELAGLGNLDVLMLGGNNFSDTLPNEDLCGLELQVFTTDCELTCTCCTDCSSRRGRP